MIPSLPERMHEFRSIGSICEFGFVQRYFGAEPSSLFRFAYTPIHTLIRSIAEDFQGYGSPGDLLLEEADTGAYYCRSQKYNVWWNTGNSVGSITPDVLLEREYGRVSHLRTKMLEELAVGSKILVRTILEGETQADLASLQREIERHGPSHLLRVTEDGSDWRPHPVRQIGERVFEGGIRRFARDRAWDVDLEPWLALCDGAYAARFGLSRDDFEPDAPPSVMSMPGKLRLHRAKPEQPLTSYARAVDPGTFDPGKTYVFSAWVWIIEEGTPARVFASAGHERLGWRDADLARRNCWQRVWAAGRFRPGEDRAPVGLGTIGGHRESFWSCRASFHEGFVPRADSPPAVVAEPRMARWLTRWRLLGR